MSLIGFQGLEWLAALGAGSLATIGAIVALGLVVEVVQGVFAGARRLISGRARAPRLGNRPRRAARLTIFGDRIGPVEHSLLAREAWWRLRC